MMLDSPINLNTVRARYESFKILDKIEIFTIVFNWSSDFEFEFDHKNLRAVVFPTSFVFYFLYLFLSKLMSI